MKSPDERQTVTFSLLQTRLLELISHRLNHGDFTERGLARIIGVSQPQIHNVLKGKRRLQPALADRILQRFGIDILALLGEDELRTGLVAGPVQGIYKPVSTLIPDKKGPAKAYKNNLIDEIKAG